MARGIAGSLFGSPRQGDLSGRIRSVPDDRLVERHRAREVVEGPRAPQNSIDTSVIFLGDDSEAEDVEAFDAAPVPVRVPQVIPTPTSRVSGGAMDLAPHDLHRGRSLDVTPPVMLRGNRLDTTIDLTNSPVVTSHGARQDPIIVGDSALEREAAASETSALGPSPASSPTEVRVTCPICLDSARSLQLQGKSLVSTVCGHIFCSPCLTSSLRARHFCPTCRRVLISRRDYHPIFLG